MFCGALSCLDGVSGLWLARAWGLLLWMYVLGVSRLRVLSMVEVWMRLVLA